MRRLLEQTLRHALKRHKPTESACVAIQMREPAGVESLAVDERVFPIQEARTLLEIRHFLSEYDGQPCVLLTPLETHALPQDILVRLVGRHVHSLSPWNRLAEALGLRSEKDIDSQLRRVVPDLPKELLSHLPPHEMVKQPDGRLPAVRAWRMVQEHVFGLPGELSGLEVLRLEESRSLLKWRCGAANLRPAFLKSIESQPDGAVVAWMLGQCLRDSGPSLVVLGIVMGVVNAEQDTQSREQLLCQGRLEAVLSSVPSDAVRRILCESAQSMVMDMEQRRRREVLHHAQALLEQLQGTALSWTSDLLPEGFRQRWQRFAESLRSEGAGHLECLVELRRLEAHGDAAEQGERLRMARMAVRLKHWLGLPPTPLAGLKQNVEDYLTCTAWVDLAVQGLVGGDASPEFDEAIKGLLESVSLRRERMQKGFAQALANEQGNVCSGMLPIEEVLSQVVKPLAATRKVLVIVMDGLSWACALEILEDVQAEWRLLGNETIAAGSPLLPVGSSIPTVTEFARASLLSGRACKGGQDQERAGFSNLFPSGSLFHKAELSDQRGQGVSAAVQDRIRQGKDLVALVLNAVDDQLKGSGQLRVRWNRQNVPLLQSLLGLASQTGCLVVLASDHGHVLETGTQLAPGGEGGERWLPPERPCLDGEILIQGKRLEAWAGDVLVPWSEKLRYAPVHNGYHGGVTTQEWLAPLCVLAPLGSMQSLPQGWQATELIPPRWWSLEALPVLQSAPLAATSIAVPSSMSVLQGTPLLGEMARSWIQAILESDVMEMQSKIAGRAAKPEMARRALEAFDAAPDQEEVRIHRATMAQRARETPTRLQGWIALVGRLLNVDNTECFGTTPDGQQLFLKPRLLVRQFGVEDQV